MKIEFDDDFWYDKKDDKSRVFQVFPSVFGDDRGTFTEIWKSRGLPTICGLSS